MHFKVAPLPTRPRGCAHLELIHLPPLLDHKPQLSRTLESFAQTVHFKPLPQVCSLEGKPISMCVPIALGLGGWTEIGPAATRGPEGPPGIGRSQNRKRRGQAFICIFFFWPCCMWDVSFQTRDQTCTPALEAWSLKHCTTREVPYLYSCSIPSPSLQAYYQLFLPVTYKESEPMISRFLK